jgi:hypothetical protein
MVPEIKKITLGQIILDQAIYPRKTHNPAVVQQYATVLDEIEARQNFISISESNKLLDGKHRYLAYLKNFDSNKQKEIDVYVYPTKTDADCFALAVELNSSHGQQLSNEDKKLSAINLYSMFGFPIGDIAKMVSVKKAVVIEWLKPIKDKKDAEENEQIFNMWLACCTQDEIAEALEIPQQTITDKLKVLPGSFPGTKSVKLSNFDEYEDVPLYTGAGWTFSKKTNEVSHFGNSEVQIVDKLLYLFTNPYDIVVDPFAGGGSTIDICKKRLRRYWASDRKPIVERSEEIRILDVIQELPPLYNRWKDVALTYLDPPYWKQAENQYSQDAEDLANMSSDDFHQNIANLINGIAKKQSKGAIALLLQPTQWKAPEKQTIDHIFEICKLVKNKYIRLAYRIQCPYPTQQFNPQMVNWAKKNKELLVNSRELIIWKITSTE